MDPGTNSKDGTTWASIRIPISTYYWKPIQYVDICKFRIKSWSITFWEWEGTSLLSCKLANNKDMSNNYFPLPIFDSQRKKMSPYKIISVSKLKQMTECKLPLFWTASGINESAMNINGC